MSQLSRIKHQIESLEKARAMLPRHGDSLNSEGCRALECKLDFVITALKEYVYEQAD